MQYHAVVGHDVGGRMLISFPDCPGCDTFAEPDEDVLTVAREALEGWLEANLVTGEVPPRPSGRVRAPAGSKVIAIGIDPVLAARIQVRQARTMAGLTQSALAKLVGVSQQAIGKLESPDANLELRTLAKIADALEMDVRLELAPRAKLSPPSTRPKRSRSPKR